MEFEPKELHYDPRIKNILPATEVNNGIALNSNFMI